MQNKYKIKNNEEAFDMSGETADIKKIQRELGNAHPILERVGEWVIYVLIIFALAWVIFRASIVG